MMKTINKINSYIISILYSFLLHGIVLRDKKKYQYSNQKQNFHGTINILNQ